VKRSSKSFKLNIYDYSFFIFAFHGLPTIFLVKLSTMIFENNHLYLFFSYLVIPILVVCLSLSTAFFLKKLTPKIYNRLVGFR
jgi:hypothetical protein